MPGTSGRAARLESRRGAGFRRAGLRGRPEREGRTRRRWRPCRAIPTGCVDRTRWSWNECRNGALKFYVSSMCQCAALRAPAASAGARQAVEAAASPRVVQPGGRRQRLDSASAKWAGGVGRAGHGGMRARPAADERQRAPGTHGRGSLVRSENGLPPRRPLPVVRCGRQICRRGAERQRTSWKQRQSEAEQQARSGGKGAAVDREEIARAAAAVVGRDRPTDSAAPPSPPDRLLLPRSSVACLLLRLALFRFPEFSAALLLCDKLAPNARAA